MMELKKYKISEIIETFIPGDWGDEAPSESAPNAVKCVRGADIVPIWNNDYGHIPVRYVSNRSFANKQLKVGDIIIEKSGGSPTQSTGRTTFVSEELIKSTKYLVCTNFCTAFRIKTGWNPKYVYYFLQHLYNNDVFFNFEGKTSGLKNLQIENAFDKATIVQVSIEKQNQVVEVLDTIDRKISLNRAINRNLEAMAKQLYDYWFVQFDFPDENGKPYKSSGGKMVWNEVLKREIPEGWEVKDLSTYLSVYVEKISSKDIDSNMKYAPIEVLPRNKMSFCESVSIENAVSGLCKFYRKNILLSNRRVYFHKVCIASYDGVTRDTVIVLIPTQEENLGYVYQLVNDDVFIEYATRHSYGTEQPVLSWETAKSYKIIKPATNLDLVYSNRINLIIDNILNNETEIASLTRQRDELLPLLMNGQVKVGE